MADSPRKGQASGAAGDVKTPPPAKPSRYVLHPGQTLGGNYEVIDQIGEGGMAIVYRALQKSLNRLVAIKALHPRFARDEAFIKRFEAEAGALATLSHPNVLTIIDRGSEGEVYYFVTEYVDGEDLDKKIIKNVLTPPDWRKVVSACSEAMDFVHRRGVIHRDIKPSNILVSSEGQIKMGDFGIAHIVKGLKTEDTPVRGADPTTSASRPVGTSHYMAPEQMSDPSNVDARADIYSLAVAFYKMMARQLPIGEFPAPSEANPDVPVAVDAVIYRAMAPDRDDRYATVKEFCDELLLALKQQSMSITSVFQYKAKGSSSLYTGADFKNRTGDPGGDTASGKPGTDPGKGKSGAGLKKRKTHSGTGGSRSGLGLGSRAGLGIGSRSGAGTGSGSITSASGLLTPKPAVPSTRSGLGMSDPLSPTSASSWTKESSEQHPRNKKAGSGKMIIVVALAVLIFIAGIVATVIALQSRDSRPRARAVTDPNESISGAVSPALEKERRDAEFRRQMDEKILNAGTEATPAPPETE